MFICNDIVSTICKNSTVNVSFLLFQKRQLNYCPIRDHNKPCDINGYGYFFRTQSKQALFSNSL